MAEKVNPLYTAAIRLIKLRDSGKITKAEFDKRMGAAFEKNITSGYGKKFRNRAKGGIIKANKGTAVAKKKKK